jgi:hypothetical protein
MKAGVHVSIKNYVCVCVCARAKHCLCWEQKTLDIHVTKNTPEWEQQLFLLFMIKIKQCFPNVHREKRQNLKLGAQCRYITSQLKSGRKTGLETEQL